MREKKCSRQIVGRLSNDPTPAEIRRLVSAIRKNRARKHKNEIDANEPGIRVISERELLAAAGML